MSDDQAQIFDAMSHAREAFLQIVADLRPELHRYAARMMGSVIDGEDVVQDTLAKGYFALSQMAEPPPLRPWLFRIAHNTAMDHLRRYDRTHVDFVADPPERPQQDDGDVDLDLVEAAVTVFAALPPVQRSALVLKDVLGHSLAETAATMGTSVQAVKNALKRARTSVAGRTESGPEPEAAIPLELRSRLQGYADLFNARDWDGLRALIADECRLDLVSRAQRRGAGVREYYQRYREPAPREDLRAAVVLVEGRPALGIFRPSCSETPAYFILLEWEGARVASIRDYRYATYVARDARMAIA